MGNVELTRWIHKDLIKPFQKSIGSMGPRCRPAKKQKVEVDSHMCYLVIIVIIQVLKQFPISTLDAHNSAQRRNEPINPI